MVVGDLNLRPSSMRWLAQLRGPKVHLQARDERVVDWNALLILPEQLVPHVIPAGVLVTVPLPLPALLTVRVKVGVKVAVTVVAAVRVTLHAPVPVQPPPLQPVKTEPIAGVAVSVTTVPLA